MSKKQIIGLSYLLVIAVLVIIGIFWIFGGDEQVEETVEPLPEPPPVAQETEPEITSPEPVDPYPQPEPPPPEEVLTPVVKPPPELENSDKLVLEAVTDFAPTLSKWLIPDEQVRKWVLTIDLMADGKLPKRYRPVDYPMEKFKVDVKDEEKLASEDNYARMDKMVDTLTTIDPALLARYYKEWLPLLEKAYQEQGKSGTFDQRFKQSISQLLATDTLSEQPELIQPSVLYRYKDKAKENASDIEKLVWRIGPDNTEKLQVFLRELRSHIDS